MTEHGRAFLSACRALPDDGADALVTLQAPINRLWEQAAAFARAHGCRREHGAWQGVPPL